METYRPPMWAKMATAMVLGGCLPGCFLLKPADQAAPEPNGAAQEDEALPTAAYRARYEEIEGASADTARALADLRREMFVERARQAKAEVPRMTRQALIDASPEERAAYSRRGKAFRKRWRDASDLATQIRYRRASILAGSNDTLGALRELAWPTSFGRGEEIISTCYSEGKPCEGALTAVQGAYGALGVVQNEHAVADRAASGDSRGAHVVIDLVASAAVARGSGWTVSGRVFKPGKVRNCHGFYQTHEIVAVKPKSVTVRETDWCKKITHSLSKGLQVTYQIDELPFELAERSRLRVLVERDKVTCRDGAVRRCTVKDVAVIAADTNKQAWRAGSVLPLAASLPF